MARNGAGNYSLIANYEAVPNETIESAKFNATVEDLASAHNDSLLLSGVKPMTGDLAMGSNKVTGLADGTASTDAATKGQVDTALAGKQPIDDGLTSIAGLTTSANQMIYTTGSDLYATTALTAFARTILDDADASTVLSTLGVSTFAKTILDDADAATVRATLGLGNLATQDTEDFLSAANNLSDLSNASTARTNLGLGSVATLNNGSVDASTLGGVAASNYARLDQEQTFTSAKYFTASGFPTVGLNGAFGAGLNFAGTGGRCLTAHMDNSFTNTFAEFWKLNGSGAYEQKYAIDNNGDVYTRYNLHWHAGNFAKPVFSSSLSIPASGASVTFAHGIGSTPRLFGAYLECTSADAGYSVGDRVEFPRMDGDAGRSASVFADSTTVGMSRFGSIAVCSKSGSANVVIDTTKWVIILWAQNI